MSADRPQNFKLRFAARAVSFALVIGLCGAGVAYALGYFDPEPRAVEIRPQLQAVPADRGGVDEQADNDQRPSLVKDMAIKARNLPAELRRPLEDQGRAMMAQHMRLVLAMSPAEQTAAIDKDIDLARMIMEDVRKQHADREATARNVEIQAVVGESPSDPVAANTGDGDLRGQSAGSGTPGASEGRPSTTAVRNAAHNRMLSSVPAASRAQWTQFMQLMNARAAERGISLPCMGQCQ